MVDDVPPHFVNHREVGHRIDEAVLEVVRGMTYGEMLPRGVVGFVHRRFRLPARMRGCGIRSVVDVSYAAYCACFVESVERMLDRWGHQSVIPGFFPMLQTTFGAGAFTTGGNRLAGWLARHSSLGHAFRSSWSIMRAEVQGAGVAGPLDQPPSSAGHGAGAQLQRAITSQREQVARDRLHREISLLPVEDPQREAWFAEDRLSSQWVSAWPTHAVEIESSEFVETVTTYLGRESAALRPFGGQGIPSQPPRVCDPYGFELGRAPLPGAPFTDCHNAVAHEFFSIMGEAGVRVDIEPRYLYASLIPDPELYAEGQQRPTIICDGIMSLPLQPSATRRGARAPRAAVQRRWHFDVKCLFGGGGLYRSPRARDEQSGAVAERAHRVWSEYQTHARRLDREHSPPGTTPILDRLHSFHQTRGLVFGQYSEASPDVHACLSYAATQISRRRWREFGARSADEARGFVMQTLRRRMGVVTAREMARHRLHRLPYVGVPRAAIERRQLHPRALMGQRRPGLLGDLEPQDFYAHQLRVQPPRGA